MADIKTRPLPGFPGYLIDQDGGVWSLWKRMGPKCPERHIISDIPHPIKMIKQKGKHCTRYKVNLKAADGSIKRNLMVHQLVALVFIGPQPKGMEVRHLNGNPLDNRVGNLCYGTPVENAADRDRHGMTARGQRHWNATITDSQAEQVLSMLRSGMTVRQVVEFTGFGKWCVQDIASGRSWRHLSR